MQGSEDGGMSVNKQEDGCRTKATKSHGQSEAYDAAEDQRISGEQARKLAFFILDTAPSWTKDIAHLSMSTTQ